MNKKYPSKVSYGLLIFIFLAFFGPFIFQVVDHEVNPLILISLLFLLILYGFILYIFFQTVYIIENGQLKIKMGFFSFKSINIDDIKEIVKTSSILSSPAPSFDRIEIKQGKFGSIIISPKDKISFARDLRALNPKINSSLI